MPTGVTHSLGARGGLEYKVWSQQVRTNVVDPVIVYKLRKVRLAFHKCHNILRSGFCTRVLPRFSSNISPASLFMIDISPGVKRCLRTKKPKVS